MAEVIGSREGELCREGCPGDELCHWVGDLLMLPVFHYRSCKAGTVVMRQMSMKAVLVAVATRLEEYNAKFNRRG